MKKLLIIYLITLFSCNTVSEPKIVHKDTLYVQPTSLITYKVYNFMNHGDAVSYNLESKNKQTLHLIDWSMSWNLKIGDELHLYKKK